MKMHPTQSSVSTNNESSWVFNAFESSSANKINGLGCSSQCDTFSKALVALQNDQRRLQTQQQQKAAESAQNSSANGKKLPHYSHKPQNQQVSALKSNATGEVNQIPEIKNTTEFASDDPAIHDTHSEVSEMLAIGKWDALSEQLETIQPEGIRQLPFFNLANSETNEGVSDVKSPTGLKIPNLFENEHRGIPIWDVVMADNADKKETLVTMIQTPELTGNIQANGSQTPSELVNMPSWPKNIVSVAHLSATGDTKAIPSDIEKVNSVNQLKAAVTFEMGGKLPTLGAAESNRIGNHAVYMTNLYASALTGETVPNSQLIKAGKELENMVSQTLAANERAIGKEFFSIKTIDTELKSVTANKILDADKLLSPEAVQFQKQMTAKANHNLLNHTIIANQQTHSTHQLMEQNINSSTYSFNGMATTNEALNSMSMSTPAAFHPMNLRQNIAPNLAMRIQWMFSQAMSSAEVMLDPPELGPMTVKVQQTNGEASILFQVNNQLAKEALDENLARLKEMLQQQGIQLADAQVEQHSPSEKDSQSGQNEKDAKPSNDQQLTDSQEALRSQEQLGLVDIYT